MPTRLTFIVDVKSHYYVTRKGKKKKIQKFLNIIEIIRVEWGKSTHLWELTP